MIQIAINKNNYWHSQHLYKQNFNHVFTQAIMMVLVGCITVKNTSFSCIFKNSVSNTKIIGLADCARHAF